LSPLGYWVVDVSRCVVALMDGLMISITYSLKLYLCVFFANCIWRRFFVRNTTTGIRTVRCNAFVIPVR